MHIAHTQNNLNELARHLLRVWQSAGKECEILSHLNADVINAETSTGTLFRGNSLASKGMDQFMKMIAIPYLHAAVGNQVKVLFEERRTCELDPARNGKQENLKVLIGHAAKICAGIFESVEFFPLELRILFAKLQECVTKKFPEDKTVRYTVVTAFIFLRLFCPAIMNPKLFNMMPDHPTETAARNLTLVAKVIQNLANMAEFGQKEPFMIPCNSFINETRKKMQIYLDAISVRDAACLPLLCVCASLLPRCPTLPHPPHHPSHHTDTNGAKVRTLQVERCACTCQRVPHGRSEP